MITRGPLGAILVAGALAIGLAMGTDIRAASAAEPPPADELAPAAVTPGSGPVSVAVVMPLTVPPTTAGLLGSDALATYTQDGGLLDRQLDAVSGTIAAIGLDPMIVASIRVLGSAAPASALEFLTRLRGLPNEVFLLRYADADPALAAAADSTDALRPLGFDFAIDPANFGPAASPTPTVDPSQDPDPTASPDPEETTAPDDGPPPLPTTEDLLTWPTTLPAIAWPSEGSVDAAGLEGIAAQGFTDALLSSDNVSATSTALMDVGDLDALVVDENVSGPLRDAAFAPTEVEYQAALITLSAALRAQAITSPGRTIIATLDRRWPFGTPQLREVLSAVDAQSSSQLVPLSQVLAGPKGSGTLREPGTDTDAARADVLNALAAAAREEASYLTIAENPGILTQPRRLALLALSAVGWRADQVGWDAATADELADAQATLDAVQITESSDQLVLSDISSLRLHVSNALPVAVTVYVVVQPTRPLLHVEDARVEVTVEPDSSATASVPVESISNGEVIVRAELHDAAGGVLGDARFLTVILQAGWETAGTLIAGGLVLLIFGGGLVRTVLRRRRARAEAVADGTDGTDSSDG